MMGLLYGICVSILRGIGDRIAASFPKGRSEVMIDHFSVAASQL